MTKKSKVVIIGAGGSASSALEKAYHVGIDAVVDLSPVNEQVMLIDDSGPQENVFLKTPVNIEDFVLTAPRKNLVKPIVKEPKRPIDAIINKKRKKR